MTSNTLRLRLLREEVNLMTCCVLHLEQLGVIVCVAFLAESVLDNRRFSDFFRVLEQNLSDVVKAL